VPARRQRTHRIAEAVLRALLAITTGIDPSPADSPRGSGTVERLLNILSEPLASPALRAAASARLPIREPCVQRDLNRLPSSPAKTPRLGRGVLPALTSVPTKAREGAKDLPSIPWRTHDLRTPHPRRPRLAPARPPLAPGLALALATRRPRRAPVSSPASPRVVRGRFAPGRQISLGIAARVKSLTRPATPKAATAGEGASVHARTAARRHTRCPEPQGASWLRLDGVGDAGVRDLAAGSFC
jgi:hypothetical protein